MRRVLAACITQKIHFMPPVGTPQSVTKEAVQKEYQMYKALMDRRRTKYKILSETNCDDGTLVIEIVKQNNSQNVGEYLN